MRKIRKAVFETNSSSSHSIHIDAKTKLYETILPDDNGVITLRGGQYGWEWEKSNESEEKANYLATFATGNDLQLTMLKEVISEHTGAKEVIFTGTDDWDSDNHVYIDHQSAACEGGDAGKAFNSKEDIKNFVFNSNSWLYRGNDNEESPFNYYEESLEKKFGVKIKNFKDIFYSDNLEDSWDLRQALHSILKKNNVITGEEEVEVDEKTNICLVKLRCFGKDKKDEILDTFTYSVIPKGTLMVEKS